jgi:hypothetical protein
LPLLLPKSLSSAQKAVITGAGTPYCFSMRANKSAWRLIIAMPPWMR